MEDGQHRPDRNSDDEGEAVELEEPLDLQPLNSVSSTVTAERKYGKFRLKLYIFWKHHVSLAVPHVACRDHLALERTFLAYVRTGQAFATLGVLVAQTMRLRQVQPLGVGLDYYDVAIPLACTCYGVSILVIIIGLLRFLKLQKAMALGTTYSGGWEVITTGIIGALVCQHTKTEDGES